MSVTAYDLHGVRVLQCAAEGPLLASETDAVQLVALAFEHRAGLVAMPTERLDEAFFHLASGLAGATIQKLINYRLRVAVVGDIAHHLAASTALRDFVRESNRGRHVWFLQDLEALGQRLARERVV